MMQTQAGAIQRGATLLGVALLSGCWLLGSGYYFPADPLACAVVLALAVLTLGGSVQRPFPRRQAWIAMALLVPMAWYAPWPLRAAPLLILIGLAAGLLPIPRRWPRWLGQGAVVAGLILLVQALAMALYAGQTARSHDLPWPLPHMLAWIARLLGTEAVTDGSTVVLHSIRQPHRLAATWGLLFDPATLCFFVGGLVLLGLMVWSRVPRGRRWSGWIHALRRLTLAVVVWLPLRAALLMGFYVHRVIRSDPETPLHVMNQFLSPWVHLLLLLGPVLLAWRFVQIPTGEGDDEVLPGEKQPGTRGRIPVGNHSRPWHFPAAAGLVALAVGLWTMAVCWDPVGSPKAGRVKVVDRHSTWEPTTKRYDTKWFGHDSGYNYAAIYAYCGQVFEMSRLLQSDKIDEKSLADCDVLVIKIPTARYARKEVDAVVRFVQQGGGLLLVGDHTNVFRSSTYLNDIARQFGFSFRNDLLFGTGDSPYLQLYRTPPAPHPAVQYLPPMDFAVSCSIDPGRSRGRAVIRGTGLWSLPPEYHIENYHTIPQHRPDMRYGAFVQLWSTRCGEGRVLAFTDSTIFSNFCTFQPGKAELMRGMLQWLNHNSLFDPRPWLLVLGLLPAAAGLWLARTTLDRTWLVLLAAGTLGWVAASVASTAVGRWSMPLPQPDRPLTRVVVDRTTSDVLLCKGAYTQGEGEGYGLLEQWIPRLGCYTVRARGDEAFSGDVLVVICPSRSVSHQFRQRLVRYVAAGGKLLVVDSPENSASTANSLLWPFGLSILHGQPWRGQLSLGEPWPVQTVEMAFEVEGGQPVGRLGQRPVAATVRYQRGSVMAVGFGEFFNDANMGYSWTADPDPETLRRYDTLFALLRSLIDDEPVAAPPAPTGS